MRVAVRFSTYSNDSPNVGRRSSKDCISLCVGGPEVQNPWRATPQEVLRRRSTQELLHFSALHHANHASQITSKWLYTYRYDQIVSPF